MTGGFGAELAARIQDELFDHLDAPILRVAARDVPIPFSPPLEDFVLPKAADVIAAVKAVCYRVMAAPEAHLLRCASSRRPCGVRTVRLGRRDSRASNLGVGHSHRVISLVESLFFIEKGKRIWRLKLRCPSWASPWKRPPWSCWKFAAGEMVKKDQIVLVLETDKVTFEMPSPGDGLLHPVAASGSRIEVSQVIGYLAADAAELEQAGCPASGRGNGAPASRLSRGTTGGGAGRDRRPCPLAQAAGVKASPVARVMAKAHGVDLSAIPGSGPGGRVVRADVLKALKEGPPAAPAPVAGRRLLSVAQEIPIAGVRKVIFKNMHLSLATQAQLTLHTEASAAAMHAAAQPAERRRREGLLQRGPREGHRPGPEAAPPGQRQRGRRNRSRSGGRCTWGWPWTWAAGSSCPRCATPKASPSARFPPTSTGWSRRPRPAALRWMT